MFELASITQPVQACCGCGMCCCCPVQAFSALHQLTACAVFSRTYAQRLSFPEDLLLAVRNSRFTMSIQSPRFLRPLESAVSRSQALWDPSCLCFLIGPRLHCKVFSKDFVVLFVAALTRARQPSEQVARCCCMCCCNYIICNCVPASS